MDDGSARLGADVGGTFTDLVIVDGEALTVEKVPSRPEAPEEGVLAGLEDACERSGTPPAAIGFLGHGTTVSTNAVLEGTWSDTALVTTAGFRDVLAIGRQDRPDIYDLRASRPDPIVPRRRRFEVDERLDERGNVLEALDETALEDLLEDLGACDADSVAVALLFAYENDAHERRVAERIEESMDVTVSRSSRVHPEVREYERTLVTCLDAALAPVVRGYLDRLESGFAERGVEAPLRLMASNGGLTGAAAARERPVTTLLSGPAAGIRGAIDAAERAGVGTDLVTMDMGGTSCDVSLVRDGEPTITTDVTVGEYPVAVPTVDVHTIGAGGGSVAWIDDGGALRVGPRSAGADPGPACYCRGGTEPTTTDAHAVLGRIDPTGFVPTAAADARDRARDAIEAGVGGAYDDAVAAASGILEVAAASLEGALRVVSVERGLDPRSLGLVAFGGAGPLHASRLAAALEMPRVLVPAAAGVLSALGLLVTDARHELARSAVRPWDDVGPEDLAAIYDDLAEAGRDRLAADGIPAERRTLERAVDLRYSGQRHELRVPVSDSVAEDGLDAVAARFHERHERRFGHAAPEEPLELVTVRLRARGTIDPPALPTRSADGSPDDAVTASRDVHVAGGVHETRVYDRDAIPAESTLEGPAIVAGGATTTLVRPDDVATVDRYGNIVLEVGG